MSELQEKLDAAIWSAHTLFQKGLVGGSTGNISFLHKHRMYISRSGSCFGRLRQEDFAQVDMQGTILYGKPSKEYPMHLALYQESEAYKAVIHTQLLCYRTVLLCRCGVSCQEPVCIYSLSVYANKRKYPMCCVCAAGK